MTDVVLFKKSAWEFQACGDADPARVGICRHVGPELGASTA